MLVVTAACALLSCVWMLAAQESSKPEMSSEAKPSFEIAHVQMSAKSRQQFGRFNPVRGGRHEIQNASMLDLIRTAYGLQSDKIIGGPN
jgi:hypothetical protein